MKTLFSSYNFPEKWSEINPRFAAFDNEVNLNLQLFTDLDVAREAVVSSDCLPFQIQEFMVKVSVTLSYCAVLTARVGGYLNQARCDMDYLIARKKGELGPTAKSQAALDSAINIDVEVIKAKWLVADIEVMHTYAQDIFKTLQKDAENWRARFYGAHSDKKLTPGVEAPDTGAHGGYQGGLPPRIG